MTAELPKLMTAGLNEQVNVLGNPAQANATDELKALEFGLAVTVTLPEPPAATLRADGLVPRVRLPFAEPPAHVEVNLTDPEIWFRTEGFPTACTYST